MKTTSTLGHPRPPRGAERGAAILTALVFIALGVIILLGNLGYIPLDWDLIWRLWPTVLIYLGAVRILRYVGV